MNPTHGFLNDKEVIRSSFYLEHVATEFSIQGLELDCPVNNQWFFLFLFRREFSVGIIGDSEAGLGQCSVIHCD